MKQILFIVAAIISFGFSSCYKENDNNSSDNENKTEQQEVFQEFWDIFDRHYPLMHRKNIDWQTVYNTYYPQINASTTDDQLFDIFETIIKTVLKDGHTFVIYSDTKEAFYVPEDNSNIVNMVENNTPNKVNIIGSSANNEYLSYGTLVDDDEIGYIVSKQFEPLSENETVEFNAFKSIVDEALSYLQNKKGIIIDVRTNGGGQTIFAYYLAGRFIHQTGELEVFRNRYKIAKGSTTASLSDWVLTEADDFDGYPDSRVEGGTIASTYSDNNKITASGSFQYAGKVALLTSKHTASAAEHFTVAMKTQSKVKTIGATTFGIYGGSEYFILSSGNGKWHTNISVHDTEEMYNGTYQSFEGSGITPDELLIPTTEEVNAGRDIHIEMAVTYINELPRSKADEVSNKVRFNFEAELRGTNPGEIRKKTGYY